MPNHLSTGILFLFGYILVHFPFDYETYMFVDRSLARTYPIPFVSEIVSQRYSNQSNSSATPKILVWTPSISTRNQSGTSLLHWLQNLGRECPSECEIDSRESIREEDAAAVIFHSRTMSASDLPRTRTSKQIYVWACHEEPSNCGSNDLQLPPNFFNTSLTNLRDSRAYNLGYGEVVRTDNEELLSRISNEKWAEIFSKKKKLGLAIISNCYTSSKREYYLKELYAHVQLSLLGKCFGRQRVCSDKESTGKCFKELFDSHFFYFAFENAICKDYVSEKVFHRLRNNIVPVVMRRRILEGIIPSGAFIAADDFNTPKEMAKYLITVSINETLYKQYFTWRESHAISSDTGLTTRRNGICALCSDLRSKTPRSSSNYIVRDHYSPRLCEKDIGCKLVGRQCKSERNVYLHEPKSYFMDF